VMHMKRTADRLFGDAYQWSVLGAGRNQMPIAAMSVAMGGNVRVGLEDSLWAGPGRLAKSNAEQVTTARKLIEGLGLEIATPDEARIGSIPTVLRCTVPISRVAIAAAGRYRSRSAP
ncbi:MAG: 3-keto-5-aminohexanoate cleavage protein, partial [Rhodospirillaceae bacterium]|nr:3-keto-5-aminohexanoate cleavage protein [Rhodospirillaceae bacterium]